MANSQLEEIISAMCAWPLSINGENVRAPQGEDLPDNPTLEVLPLRIITPAIDRLESKKIQQLTFGTSNSARDCEWTIQDLMLFVSHAEYMNNVHAVNRPTVRYIVAYEACVATYTQVVSTAKIEQFSVQPGLYRFPAGTEQWWYGVLATHRIREIVNG